MAWEKRGNNRYYYRKQRSGRNVTSEYVGNGPLAQLISSLDQEEWEERSLVRTRWKKQKKEVLTMDADLATIHELTISLVRAALLTEGYHPHKGQWRRKRNV
jgi:hypothetical protein